MITVASIRTTRAGEYIGRRMPRQRLAGSPLGNPFPVPQFSREEALERYQDWLADQLQRDTPARREFDRLVALARAGDLTLLCWCAPLACHGDIIKTQIECALERGDQ